MAWSKRQKQLVHQYARWAGLPSQEYRALLERVSGCASAAHPALTEYHFEQFMARLETILDSRVAEQLVQPPAAWRSRTYWRDRLPKTGQANSRQIHEIYDWWYKLQPYLDQGKRNPGYLRAIAANACRLRGLRAVPDLTGWQAGLVIEALKDRLRWALKDRNANLAVEEPADTCDVDLYQDEDVAPDQSCGTPYIPDEVPF
jgi:hypothetical protein